MRRSSDTGAIVMGLPLLDEAVTAADKRGIATGDTRQYAIGDLAREFGVSLRTLRFYEDRGLLLPRREGSSRIYSPRDRLRLQMILKGKQLGFTLTEVLEMIGRDRPGAALTLELALKPDQVQTQIAHLERQRSEIDDAIAELRSVNQKMQEASFAG